MSKSLIALAFALLCTASAVAQDMPAEYQQVLTTLDATK